MMEYNDILSRIWEELSAAATGWVQISMSVANVAAVTTGSTTLADYRRCGYDRGNLAPAMAWSEEVMSEWFYLSNMGPQDPGFNRGLWRQLEARVCDWAVGAGLLLQGSR